MTNPLEKWFASTQGRQVHKWKHYFDIYHRHLQQFRGRKVKIVEFGVSLGGSAQMWHEYFGPRAKLYGIDIEPRCKNWETSWFSVFIGDQADRRFLRKLKKKIGKVDVVIEDGGHHPDQQIATFEEFYPQVKPGGVFLIEDLHTSYWKEFGGGLQRSGTFMEYAKRLSDQLNAYHSAEPDFVVDDFTRTTRSMHFYDSVIVFEKDAVTAPYSVAHGTQAWDRPDLYRLDVSVNSRLRSAGTAVAERLGRKMPRFRRRPAPADVPVIRSKQQ